jgi:hypothetical protein
MAIRHPVKSKSSTIGLLTALAIGMSNGIGACADGRTALSAETRGRIVAFAAQDQRWNVAKVRLMPKAELDRAGCSFYIVVPEDRVVSAPGYFALLPDGQVAGIDVRGDTAAAALLTACGKEAAADWWATVVVRFSNRVGGSLLTANGNPFGIRKVGERGAAYAPPRLNGTAAGTALSFFVYDAELGVAHQVRALLSVEGGLRVDSKAL